MIRLSKSIVGEKELNAVSKVILEDGYLGMGSEVEKFEFELSSYLKVPSKSVVCVNSGTSALHIAVESLVEKGGEVLVPSFTYISSFQAISAAGAVPVSCDVYDDTFSIDLEDAQKRLSNKTRAIMVVHYASNPANIQRIYEFAKKNKIRVIEDAAHAFGCEYKGKKIGHIGDVICFSFDGIKNITSGEGGAIVTRDSDVLDKVKDKRLLSVEKDSDKRYLGKRSWDFDVKMQGYRYHMSNIFAAIGRVQLKRLDSEFAPKRIELFNKYKEILSNNPKIIFQKIEEECYVIPHICPIRILDGNRDKLKQLLEENSISTGLHYKPNHLLSFYKTDYILPITEKLFSEIITLPLHPGLTISQVERISDVINNYLNK